MNGDIDEAIDGAVASAPRQDPTDLANSTEQSSKGHAINKANGQGEVGGKVPEKATSATNGIAKSKSSFLQQHSRLQSPVMNFKLHIACRLIGECYIHGMMDGEGFKIRDERNIDEAEFEIR